MWKIFRAVPDISYVSSHELVARNFADLSSPKVTSMCVRGAPVADVAEMWGGGRHVDRCDTVSGMPSRMCRSVDVIRNDGR